MSEKLSKASRCRGSNRNKKYKGEEKKGAYWNRKKTPSDVLPRAFFIVSVLDEGETRRKLTMRRRKRVWEWKWKCECECERERGEEEEKLVTAYFIV